jgi:mRNA-degrading endonuclease HigB of HigAB toxin-antitoxin module/antitoxin component HigA of HigAB toxin-antitoxin module
MRIITAKRLREFGERYADARQALVDWEAETAKALWHNLAETRATFASADEVVVASGRPVTIFNIRGNRYRLITAVHYNTGVVFVMRFLTHADYNKNDWKDPMKSTTKAAPLKAGTPAADAAYVRLVRQYPLRPIRSEASYDAAAAMLDRLVLRADLSQSEQDYLAVLTDLVEAYDREHYPPEPETRTPLERLKAVMASAGVTPAGLQKILGLAQPTVSMILSGKRELSKPSILKLAERFRLDPSYFLPVRGQRAGTRRRDRLPSRDTLATAAGAATSR